MKTMLGFVLFCLLALPIGVSAQETGPKLDFLPSAVGMKVGEEVSVSVVLSNPGETNAAEIIVDYPNGVEILSFQENGVLLGLNKSIADGVATLDVGKVGENFVDGEVIANLKLRLLAANDLTIKFAPGTKVGDQEINTTAQQLFITSLTESQPLTDQSPEPASILQNPIVIATGAGVFLLLVILLIAILIRRRSLNEEHATPVTEGVQPGVQPQQEIITEGAVPQTEIPVTPVEPGPMQVLPVVTPEVVEPEVREINQVSGTPQPIEPELAEMNASPKLKQIMEKNQSNQPAVDKNEDEGNQPLVGEGEDKSEHKTPEMEIPVKPSQLKAEPSLMEKVDGVADEIEVVPTVSSLSEPQPGVLEPIGEPVPEVVEQPIEATSDLPEKTEAAPEMGGLPIVEPEPIQVQPELQEQDLSPGPVIEQSVLPPLGMVGTPAPKARPAAAFAPLPDSSDLDDLQAGKEEPNLIPPVPKQVPENPYHMSEEPQPVANSQIQQEQQQHGQQPQPSQQPTQNALSPRATEGPPLSLIPPESTVVEGNAGPERTPLT